ncbi:hypothetical protein [Shimia ponticola]|uniref:hypothetical protein n=1 Tax=Shimia ponticola TaxID=2582893 RepID=UPI0011BD8918|nr:hypothetical protein [Shimia ponticola]
MKNALMIGLLLGSGAMAHADVLRVDENGMTAVLLRTPLNLDAPFQTDMVTVTVTPASPDAQDFATRIACEDAVVMGVDRSRSAGPSVTFSVLCGDYD